MFSEIIIFKIWWEKVKRRYAQRGTTTSGRKKNVEKNTETQWI